MALSKGGSHEKFERAERREAPGGNPIVPSGSSSAIIRIVCESDPVIMIVGSRYSIERGARVDRDHDHLLREFMRASDE